MVTARHCGRIRTSVAAILLLASSQLLAQDAKAAVVKFNIKPQPLAQALNTWADQSGMQIIWPVGDPVAYESSPAVRGALEPMDALRALLGDSGLTYSIISDGQTVAIHGRDGSTLRAAATDGRDLGRPVSEANAAAQGRVVLQTGQVSDSPAPRMEGIGVRDLGVEEVLVTGTLIRGSQPIGSPLITVDRSEIERTGYATLQDVMRTLPQNVPSRDSELTGVVGGFGSDNTSYGTGIDLRGLGPDATLTLLNGRRLAPAGISSFVDISAIPLAMVDRIEIVPDGSSALYGSDAIGGVVNVRLREDYEGVETRLRYGRLTDGDVPESDLSQIFGTGWGSGHLFLGYEYYERDSLSSSARRFTNDSDLRAFGGDNFSGLESNPGNIIQVGDVPLSLAIPADQDGTALSEAQLLPDTVNLQNLRAFDELLPRHRRQSAVLSLSQTVGAQVKLFADVLYTDHDYRHRDERSGVTFVVPESNAYRQLNNLFPGAGDMVMAYNLTSDFGPATKSGSSRAVSGSVGGSFQVGESWVAETSLRYGKVRESVADPQFVDMVALSDALASSDLATAFNPFADGSNTDPSVLSALLGRLDQKSETEIKSINVSADGNLFAAPGGTAKAAVGGEIREESYRFSDITTSASGDAAASAFFLPRERTVRAAFAEFTFPVFGTENARPGFQRVDLSLSGRYEDYSDIGESTAPKFGINWSPVGGITFRGSLGRSFKAPLLKDLGTLSEAAYGPIPAEFDPLATDDSTLILLLGGGNRNLKPEKAKTWTLGVQFAPLSNGSPRLDLNYFHVDLKDRVRFPASTLIPIFQTPDLYPGVLIRNPTDAQIQAALASVDHDEFVPSPTPPVEAIVDFRLQNIAAVEVDGLDMSSSYRLATRAGDFLLAVSGSYLFAYDERFSSTAPSTSVVSTMGRPADLRLRGGFSWSRGNLIGSAFANYVDDYRDTLSVPNRRIDSWTTVDVQLSYSMKGLLGDFIESADLSLSATNVLDKQPPFANWPTGFGFDAANADPYGRRISLDLAVKW